jgi:molybdenum cofactor cytidylyltransferase
VIGAIILAAGSGSRMGRTKQLLTIDGQSLVRRTIQAAVDARLEPVIVVTGADAAAVAGELTDLPVTVVHNENWESGIGTSIRRGISALLTASPQIDATAILLCDQPRLAATVLRDLIGAFSVSSKPIAACEYAGTAGPPCCFNRSIFGELAAIPDMAGAKKLLLVDPKRLTIIPWPDGAEDLDTPTDWQRFNQPRD